MKKKILGVVVVTVIAFVAGYNVCLSQNKVELSDLALANVEAFASKGEWETPFYVHPCPTTSGTECSSTKYDELKKCAKLTYCQK